MTLEVELKYPVVDLRHIESAVARIAAWSEPVRQLDHYFAHPARDFAATDEAFRLRTVGARNEFTYKGPKFDPASKTRREINLGLAEGPDAARLAAELVESLGFRRVLLVAKTRRVARLARGGREIEIALDLVDSLGHFVEIETIADEASLPAARSLLETLAHDLELRSPERRSYLELLLIAAGR